MGLDYGLVTYAVCSAALKKQRVIVRLYPKPPIRIAVRHKQQFSYIEVLDVI